MTGPPLVQAAVPEPSPLGWPGAPDAPARASHRGSRIDVLTTLSDVSGRAPIFLTQLMVSRSF